MFRIWIALNGDEFVVDLPYGHSWQADIRASVGVTQLTAWCQHAPVGMMLRDSSFHIVNQQWGQIVTAEIAGDGFASLLLTLSVNQRVCSSSDAKLIDEATAAMKRLAVNTKSDPEYAASLIRASRLTNKVATFLTEEDEFCVIKRKLQTKGKRIAAPQLRVSTCAVAMMTAIGRGRKRWKQGSGSFSTMMRFIQRSKEEFQWESLEEQAATMLSTLILPH